MASARARQAFRDGESDDESPQQTALHRSSRRKLDSSGDEGAARQATLQRRPLASAVSRWKHAGAARLEDSGDLRPTTPPAGPSSRGSRPSDWANAVLQMLQQSALTTGLSIQGPDIAQRSAAGSISSNASRRQTPIAGGPTHRRVSVGLQSSSSTKIAAARKLDNSSSDEDGADLGLETRESASAEVKPQAQPIAEPRGTRPPRLHSASSLGSNTTADNTNAPSIQLTSSAGRILTGSVVGGSGGGCNGSFATTAAGACEGRSEHGQSVTNRQQQRASRLRRASGNDSVASEVSHQESLASSRQTLGSSKLSATVQRVVARQRLVDSSSGEEDNDLLQGLQQVDSNVGQAARLLARIKSQSSSISASGFPPTAAAPPSPTGVVASGRKSPTAAVAMILTTKSKGAGGSTASAAAAVRSISAERSGRRRGQAESETGEAGAFSFKSMGQGDSVIGDGISPRMHQAAAAATAEVTAAAASSLRPLPLTTIVAARLMSSDRSRMATQEALPERNRSAPLANAQIIAGFVAARQAVASTQSGHVSSSQRITTWLEQQPSLSSVGIADDIVSEYATTVTGTEVELDHAVAGVKESRRTAAMAVIKSIMSGNVGLPVQDPATKLKTEPSCQRAVRLTVSSDEEAAAASGGGHKPSTERPVGATDHRKSMKKLFAKAESVTNSQLSGDRGAHSPAGGAQIAQDAPADAATTNTAARRLDFDGSAVSTVAASSLMKEHISCYSSPSFRPCEIQSHPSTLLPLEAPEATVFHNDKAAIARAFIPATSPQTGVVSKERTAITSSVGRRRRTPEADGKKGLQKEDTLSPESSTCIGSHDDGKRRTVSPLAAAGRLTPNELRVMLSVLSRPPWAAHAAASTLSPQPSHSADSVQSFSYSEMLQVMRAMSSSSGGADQQGGSTQDGFRSGRSHKSDRKGSASGGATMAGAASRRPPSPHHNPQQSRFVRDLPTVHRSLGTKASHTAGSFDGSSCNGSLLGEHPMAAPQERSGSASNVSGYSCSHDQQQQRDFTEMVRLWSMLTGRQPTQEPVNLHLNPDGTATPRSGRRGSASVRSGGSSSVTHPSAAALAASAAAMATSAVMAAAGGPHHHNSYLQAVNLHPFLDPVTAATAANHVSQDIHLQQHRSTSPQTATGSKARSAPSAAGVSPTCAPASAATAPRASSPAQAHPPRPKSFNVDLSLPRKEGHQQEEVPSFIQANMLHLIHLLDAAGQANFATSGTSEVAKNDLNKLMHMLRGGAELADAASLPQEKECQAAIPGPVEGTAAVVGGAVAAERPWLRPPSSRRSSADTVETGLALGRLYKSLRNLRVRDEGGQTDGAEEPIAQTTLRCAQTNSANLQAPAACGTYELELPGACLPGAGLKVRSVPALDPAPCNKAPEDLTMSTIHDGAPGQLQLQTREGSPGGCALAAAVLPTTAASSLPGRGIYVTRALKLPSGQLMELDPLLALASDEKALGVALGDADGTVRQWLQDLRVLDTPQTAHAVCASSGRTNDCVQTDLTVSDHAVVLPLLQHQQLEAAVDSHRLTSDGTVCYHTSRGVGSDSAAALGTSVTAAPAIIPTGAVDEAPRHLSIYSSAVFPMRNLPIASEGGIMAMPNQEAVTAGRVGSAGGMLAYLEAADPTTATALMELVQALQLMTLHSRRRRWMSDGSSTASGAYLVEPPTERDSLGGSSGGATTLRYSFGTSIGPSVSQAGHASLIDMPDFAGPGMGMPPAPHPVKAATAGGVHDSVPGEVSQPKRHTTNAGMPPRPVSVNAEHTTKHLRRALRAVSGGGTVRLTPTGVCETVQSGGGVSASANTRGLTSPGPVTEAAKIHIARALELLSQPTSVSGTDASAVAAAAARAAAADAELEAQEELVAALVALLAPGNAALQPGEGDDVSAQESAHWMGHSAPSQPATSIGASRNDQRCFETAARKQQPQPCEVMPSVPPAQALQTIQEPLREPITSDAAAPVSSISQQQQRTAATAAVLETLLAGSEVSPVKPTTQSDAASPASPLHARIQEVLQQAERASASISSLQVGLSPTAPPAAQVLEGVPFEQAIDFIMDGLRDFDGGPSNLARHLHLMYSPSNGGCVFYPTALDSFPSRRQSAVGLGPAAVLEAVAESVTSTGRVTAAASEGASEDPQPLTDAERERVQTLVSEALAAAEALARGARREEAWTAERLGLSLEGDAAVETQPAQEEPQRLPDVLITEQPPAPLSALAAASSSNCLTSPSARVEIQSESSGHLGATGKMMQIIASSSPSAGTDSVLALPQQQLSSLGSSPSPDTVAGLDTSSKASVMHDGEHAARPSSIQRSAPVTSAGVLLLGGSEDGQTLTVQMADVPSLQTLGDAMDLPGDSVFGPTVPYSTPNLPCGSLDEYPHPIQPEATSVSLQALRSSHAMAEALLASAAPAASAVTSLPTFATPSTPAVRGAVGDTVSPPTVAAAARLCNSATAPRLRIVTEGASEVEQNEQKDRQDTGMDGWESDMAGGARIRSPHCDPLEVISTAVALQPTVLPQQQLMAASTPGPASTLPPSASTVAAANPQSLAPPPPEVSTGLANPEVPVLTARDRFSSPRLACDFQPYTTESLSPRAGESATIRTISEAISSASAEILMQQSLPLSLDSDSNTKGGFQPRCLACDTINGRRTSQYVQDEVIADEPLEVAGPAQAGVSTPQAGAFTAGGEMGQRTIQADIVDSGAESRPSHVLLTAGGGGCLGAEAEAVPTTKKQTEQLLTKAAQLLLQAMQSAAQGEPEQEAAFRVLMPVLQGLAAVEGTEHLEPKSVGPVAVQHHESATALVATNTVTMAEGGRDINSDGTSVRISSPKVFESPMELTQCQQAQHQQNTVTPVLDLQQQHLATTADLEIFKDDVMAGVRSALIEVVDMIGSTVMQRGATTGAGDHVPGTEGRDTLASFTGPVGQDIQDPGDAERCSATPADQSFTPERSSSPSLAPEHQEIRITRAELEAFVFGKAVLGRSAADELLGVRLRQLYAPQLLQVNDDEWTDVHDFEGQQRRPCQRSPPAALYQEATIRGSARAQQDASHASHEIGEPLDLGKQNDIWKSQAVTGGYTAVPRESPLRQPLADGAKFKSLFRRSIEHLRDYLQPARSDIKHSPATADMDGKATRGGSQYAAPAPAGGFTSAKELHAQLKSPTVPLPRASVPRQPPSAGASMSEDATDQVLSNTYTMGATLSPAGLPPARMRQIVSTAAAADPEFPTYPAPRAISPINDDDVELEPYLSGGLLPEPTTNLARLPDPTAPAAQPPARRQLQPQCRVGPQAQSRRGTADSTPEVETIGNFLAALAEPVMQVVGVLTQPGGGTSIGSRLYPRRSIVIEELPVEQPNSKLQLQPSPDRPSRVPGFVATTSGSHVVLVAEDEEDMTADVTGAFGRSSGRGLAQMESPRAASEADLVRLHQAAREHTAAMLPHLSQARHLLHAPCSASTTPVPRSASLKSSVPVDLVDQPLTAPALPAGIPVQMQYPHAQVHTQASSRSPSRLRMSSAPGIDPLAAEDRPLSSFVCPSDDGATQSLPRRRTHSPCPLARQPVLQLEASRGASASASGVQTSRSVGVVASQPGTSLDELESFLRAFRTRIGTDEMGTEPVAAAPANVAALPSLAIQAHHQQLAVQRTMPTQLSRAVAASGGTALRDPFRRHVVPELEIEPISEVDDVRRGGNLSESPSFNTARRVITGFNMYTIRASGASALAAAAAVEEAFSPRQEREQGLEATAASHSHVQVVPLQQLLPLHELSAMGGDVSKGAIRSSTDDAGSGIAGLMEASRGSSSATPTNPVLREHLEHFQALLEKANDLVDRLMLADEDLISEGAATDIAATPSPSNTTPSANNPRRQLTYRLSQQRSGSAVATPQRQLALGNSADTDADTVAATQTPVAPTLDPELAALFPATAARLARPHAHIEQSPDAANSLLSSAVTAVPQLAKGVDHIRSKSSTSPCNSQGGSLTGISNADFQPGGRASIPTIPTPAQSVAVATPLALVASLLAEAHSRMEFQSLEEQRGADRILSAVLDEHFAHVLGTPRGFLTPPRISLARAGIAPTIGPIAAGAEAMVPTPPPAQLQGKPPHRLNAGGQESITGLFSRAYIAAAEANGAEVSHIQGRQAYLSVAESQLSQPEAQQDLMESKNLPAVATDLHQAAPVRLQCIASEGMSQPQLQQASSQKQYEEMSDFVSQVMRQRSDILTSALDHVHKVGISAAPPSPLVMSQSAFSPARLTSATKANIMQPISLAEPFSSPMPPAATAADIDAILPVSAIPGASGGQSLMPQPLMPYQEIDSDSTPTSYNVSIAGSAFHPESSANWSHGPSPHTTNIFPVDSASLLQARRVSSVLAASGSEMPPLPPSVTGGNPRRATSDSIMPPIASNATTTAVKPAAAVELHSRYDLSHLIDDDDGPLSAGPSSVFQRSAATVAPHPTICDANSIGSGRVSGVVSTLKSTSSLEGSHGHIPAVPEPPHETALRYNPVYDPAGLPSSSSLAGTAFGAAAAAAAIGELNGGGSEGGSFVPSVSGMTTLHHETAYTPLAFVVADPSDGGASGLETPLHSRLRSAGGTTTAVLVPNPMYDFPAECDRQASAMASATAATLEVAVGMPVAPQEVTCVDDVVAGSLSAAVNVHTTAVTQLGSLGPYACGSMSSSRSGDAAHHPMDGAASANLANVAPLRRAGSGTANPKAASDSGMSLTADVMGSGNTSAELSSLLANSLTESQLNLLAVAPELPNSRRQSYCPQHHAAAQWLLQQQQQPLQLNAGSAPVVVVAMAKAAITSGGGLTDVTMSLDFEEISREAAAVADTLSAHASVEAPDSAASIPGGAPSLGQSAAQTTAPATVGVPDATSPATNAITGAAEQLLLSPSVSTTPGHRRHMGDMVAAAVRRFESGIASTSPGTVGEATTVATSTGLHAVTNNSVRQSSLDAVELVTSNSLKTNTGSSADWQSVALTTGGVAGALSRQASGAGIAGMPCATASAPAPLASRRSLGVLRSSGPGAAVEEAAAATVQTREWVLPQGSQEIQHEILDDKILQEQVVLANNDPPAAERSEPGPPQEQESGRAKIGAGGKMDKGRGRSTGSAAVRQSESPVHPARRAGAAAGSTGPGSGGSSTLGRVFNNTSSVASRQQQARMQAGPGTPSSARASPREPSPGHMRSPSTGAGASSPSSARVSATLVPASNSNSSGTPRRVAASPMRTTPSSRVNRPGIPGGRSIAGGTVGVQQQLQQLPEVGEAGGQAENGGKDKQLNEAAGGNRTSRRK
ncbi:hypothetical protein Vafri_20233 [Volvox africanus]|uniref:Uncharacterized protein n=1 Tax=Volvox africanus TaxID=51714 RepID=A0A8J4BWM8_9CHLO|nr:hypothetical protein Vafri_20233 [Volvox africanus]